MPVDQHCQAGQSPPLLVVDCIPYHAQPATAPLLCPTSTGAPIIRDRLDYSRQAALRSCQLSQIRGPKAPIHDILSPETCRHGATSVGDFKEEGFLSEAMVNFLAILGWNDGSEQEIYSIGDLVEKFSLSRVTKSGAVFDKTKLRWMNGVQPRP